MSLSLIMDRNGENSIFGRRDGYLVFWNEYVQWVNEGEKDDKALIEWIADFRNLRIAWDYLSSEGGQSPGPDGLTYSNIARRDVWELLRCLSRSIREGAWHCGPERQVSITKLSGPGKRVLRLQNIADRVVLRAIMQVLQVLYEKSFDSRSFGFRQRRDRRHALAALEAIARKGHLLCLTDDIKDCFDNVPRERLHQILGKRLPGRVVALIRNATRSEKRRGLRQGSPLSPLLVNIFLDHFLDQHWRKHHPKTPLLRYADDLLVVCQAEHDCNAVYAALSQQMRSMGLPLKGKFGEAFRDLAGGDHMEWLGYRVAFHQNRNRLAVAPTGILWRTLSQTFSHAYDKRWPSTVAKHIAISLLNQLAPCYYDMSLENLTCRLRRVARSVGFGELPATLISDTRWEEILDRWEEIRNTAQDEERRASKGVRRPGK